VIRKPITVISLVLISVLNGICKSIKECYFNIERFIERLFSFQDEDINYGEFYENILLVFNDPINLNTASREDLSMLLFLDEYKINDILKQRTDYGDFISFYDLAAVSSLDQDDLCKLSHFVYIAPVDREFDRPLLERIATERNNFLMFRVERTVEDKVGYLPFSEDSTDFSCFR